jgi:ABC-type Fe3+ transport system permease subunit
MNWVLLANSLLVAALSSLVALVLGLVMAIALTVSPKALRNTFLLCTVTVLALPSFLVTNCWIDLFGVNGLLSALLPLNIFSLPGTVWILALLLWPIPALSIWSAWRKLEPIQFEIDPLLRDWNLLRYLLLPAAKSHIILAGAVVFALALNNFAVPTILQVKLFTSEMWIQFNTNLNALAALQLSWPIILVPFLLLVLLRRTEVPWPRETGTNITHVARRQFGRSWSATVMIIAAGAIVFSLLVPLAQLSVASRTWSEFIPALLAGRAALVNSILYAVFAAGLALSLALLLARVRCLAPGSRSAEPCARISTSTSARRRGRWPSPATPACCVAFSPSAPAGSVPCRAPG